MLFSLPLLLVSLTPPATAAALLTTGARLAPTGSRVASTAAFDNSTLLTNSTRLANSTVRGNKADFVNFAGHTITVPTPTGTESAKQRASRTDRLTSNRFSPTPTTTVSLSAALTTFSTAVLAASSSAVAPAIPTQLASSDKYTTYTGDGSTADGWPAMNDWMDFDRMFSYNTPQMRASCAQWSVPNNSARETREMKKAILNIAALTAIDARFILAIILQESTGCVRVITTAYSHANPGLMQSFNGTGSCNGNNPAVGTTGAVLTPCPRSQIHQQILDGTNGTIWGPGLKQDFAQQGDTGAQGYYRTARLYNGGSLAADGNLEGPCCTTSYVSDVANRLTGWAYAARDFTG